MLRLGDVLFNFGNCNLCPFAAVQANPRPVVLSKSQYGGNGGHGNNAAGQDGLADQSIQQGGLAPLELPHARDVEAALGNTFCGGAGIVPDLVVVKLLGQTGNVE